MGLLGKLFGGKSEAKTPKGFELTEVLGIDQLTGDMIQVDFAHQNKRQHRPGEYVNLCLQIDGKEQRRSYSICGSDDRLFSIGVKKVSGGKVSNWLCHDLKVGDLIAVSKPQGNFLLKDNSETFVGIAAGSGITPIMSMLKARENEGRKSILLFGNRSTSSIPFKDELDNMKNTEVHYFLSQEEKEGFRTGRIDKEVFTSYLKTDLNILKADGFYLCGPEQMISDINDVLKLFGVDEKKIHFELFTTPTILAPKNDSSVEKYSGKAKIQVVLDSEIIDFELSGKGKSILEAVNELGHDAPYSCRGGVCCTCKAKVLEGKVSMDLNYALTDKEVEEGFILTCQSHPASESVKISYDE